jgi:hypothetical protein
MRVVELDIDHMLNVALAGRVTLGDYHSAVHLCGSIFGRGKIKIRRPTRRVSGIQKAVERLRQKFVEQLKEAERLRQLADEIARKSQEPDKATLD